MKLYRLAALPLAGALILGPVLATPAFAAHPTKTRNHTVTSTSRSLPAKKPVTRPFTVVGTISAVDSVNATVTVAVRAGSRDLRGQTVAVAVGTAAKIRLDGSAATLDTLPAGAAVTLHGTRSAAVLTATKLLAHTTTSTTSG